MTIHLSNMLRLLQLLLFIGVLACGSAALDVDSSSAQPKITPSRLVQGRTYAGVAALPPAQQKQARGGHQHHRQTENVEAPTPKCEYEQLMSTLNDRISLLATLDETQRNRFDAIDNKLSQFEKVSLARLDSMAVQQMNFQHRLDVIEHIQRLTRTTVDDLKGEPDLLQNGIQNSNNNNNNDNDNNSNNGRHRKLDGFKLSRTERQAPSTEANLLADIFTMTPSSPTVQQKLDALATLLTSTAQSVNDLRFQLQANLTRLAQTTKNLQRRINGKGAHGQSKQQPGHVNFPLATPSQVSANCLDSEPSVNGIVKLQLTSSSDPFYVHCEDDGWLVVMNRFSENLNFERGWLEYKSGFGNLAGEFFIGLEKLHALTASAVHELRVELEDHEGNVATAGYSLFGIGSEEELYALNLLGTFDNGTARDSLTYHAGSKFSTFDNDNDGCLECNCAALHKGGGWFNWCAESNLMGNYFSQNYESVPENQGMFWHGFRGIAYSLRRAKMLIRPVGLNEYRR